MLKDGQIVEQGTHRELLERNGVFASMWADQNSTDEAPLPYAEQNAMKATEGYPMEPEDEPTTQSEQQDALVPSAAPDQNDISGEEVDKSAQEDVITTEADEDQAPEEQAAPADEPEKKSYADVVASEPPSDKKEGTETVVAEAAVQDSPPAEASNAPVAFPSYDADTTEPFPAPPQSPGVTFDASTQVPTPRSSTPDLSSEPKRKRTASQNFQKFARRVSLVARRSGSSTSIPVPAAKKDAQGKEGNDDGSSTPQAEGSVRGESPASSIQGDDSKKGKKDRKTKKRFSLK